MIQTQDWKLRGYLIAAVTCGPWELSDSCAAVEEVHVSVPSGEISLTFCTLLPPTPTPRCTSMHCTLVHSQMHMILQGHLIYQTPLYPYLLEWF